MSASTRRAALGAILAAPLASVPVVAAPQSDLAQACHWAIEHSNWLNSAAVAEHWDDDRIDEEVDRNDEVLDRAIVEPSRSLSDLQAKARLCLHDFEAHAMPFKDQKDGSQLDGGERLIRTVLREVIALCA